ncbi:MAG: glycosyltransferase family 4 protein [Meiothermus sp.]|uniref:glycosyltransferase family 4 protein n=1 Tax=Meiothermus sp. TaxID=1955249 RepID=UPI0028CFB416|nr:glycosyltransferase family 4 protein [Meiothermus sp.]MDT7920307.1 glycosyltransferase family 4 protein [Meiothermus sp.]
MRVCVGSAGRFHTFDLARQLERRGYLRALYTAYPRWKVDGLPPDRVRSFPWLMGPAMLAARLGLHGVPERWDYWVHETFDRWMASRLEPCEVFHCLSGFGIHAHRVARERYGALTVCDRGSSHILYQDEILAEEHARWGIPYRPIDRRIVERELQEYEFCDRIFVPSSFAYRSFVQKGVPEAKLVKIPYGVDLSLFRPVPKEDDVFRVVYVGALSLRKGIPDLLEAVCALRLPRFEVWLIGGCLPEVRPFLRKYEGRYRYLGVIPRKELYRYYSQGSVFVIASVEEGLALVQAQAMACGLPVIATTNTGAEDLFTDGVEGFIVSIRNPEAIREKVLYLYQHPEIRKEMAHAALRRVQAMEGWGRYGSAVVQAYKSALSQRYMVKDADSAG